MGVYGSPQVGIYADTNRQYDIPSTSDYVKWILIPSILSIFTCGIGGLILTVVWACSNEQLARRNLMRAFLFIAVLPLIILFIVLVMIGTGQGIAS